MKIIIELPDWMDPRFAASACDQSSDIVAKRQDEWVSSLRELADAFRKATVVKPQRTRRP